MREKVGTAVIIVLLFVPTFCFPFEIDPYRKSDESRLDLVFVPLHYSKEGDFSADVEHILSGLRKTPPFGEFIDRIGIHKVGLSPIEEERLFQETHGFPPLKIHQELFRTIEKSLRPPYKVAIIDAKGSRSCAELSAMNKVSVLIIGRGRYKRGDGFGKGFLHELGHSLGLRDECVHCSPLSGPGHPNCAANKEDALRYWGDLANKAAGVSFISGCCGSREYIRPTLGSLMNDADKADDFGPVNERYLRLELTGDQEALF
ncbi:MAG: hypothetical protein PHT59_03025 [Candidatus Omnitrophica bacterium]|nr:hypothetical protein [Candidatus Omnitrophota bacterium]